MMRKLPALALAAMLLPAVAIAQQDQAEIPEPDPADVESIDAIINAVYDVISGPAGEARDWDRMRSLFWPGARLIPTGTNPNTGQTGAAVWTVENYISQAGPQLEQGGFFEQEIGRHTDEYGNIVQVFSAYAARRTADGPVFMRGINSIQLLNAGDRGYRVMNIFWHTENPQTPIPEMYID